MFKKVFTGFIATMICSAMVLAGPAPKRVETVDGYIKEVAERTGKSEKEIREEAVEALRQSGKYSARDLERIGRGEKIEFDVAKHNEAINLLEKNSSFRARTGIAALANESIKRDATDAFDAMKEKNDAIKKANERTERQAARGEETNPAKPNNMEKTTMALGHIAEKISPRAAEAVKSVGAAHFTTMKNFALVLTKRVSKGAVKKEAAEQMIIDVAESPKALEGELVIGKGATESCMGMAGEAVENLGEFIHEGSVEGRNPVEYTKAMGKKAAEKFKQELEEGIARVCALASSGCKLFSSKIVEACQKLGGARAI